VFMYVCVCVCVCVCECECVCVVFEAAGRSVMWIACFLSSRVYKGVNLCWAAFFSG
jgi:hypothetical protein